MMEGNAALESIDRLSSHLNAALTQIGRTFRDANGTDSKLLGTSKGQSQRADPISKANSKFHEVLDEIEIEILQAKSVIERDLNGLRVAREERERGLDGSKQAALGESVELPPGVSLGDGADLLAGGLPDTAMMESFDEFVAQDTALDPAAFAAIAGDTAKNDAGATMPVNGDISKPEAPDSSNEQASSTAVDTSAAAVDANAAFDFESMFGEGANAQPFDLDFGDAGAGNDGNTAGINMDDLFNEIGASTSDFADLGASSTSAADGGGSGTAEDLESLLPDLGSYVNVENPNAAAGGTGDDFTMIDLPVGTSSADAANSGAATSTSATAANTTTAGGQDGSKTTADANGGNSARDGATNADSGAGGEMENIDEIFGDILDVGNMDGTNLDDFDWNL